MPTHEIHSIQLGPCLDQHPACGLLAMHGSKVERGELVLREIGARICFGSEEWGGGERGE